MTGTTAEPLHLDWPDCRNARDLGGTPTAHGDTIRTGALVRTDGHARLDERGIRAVHEYGVGRIIDLRREQEIESEPSPFAGSELYRNVSLHPLDGSIQPSETLIELYTHMLDGRPDRFVQALVEIATAPPGAVVVHCFAGQDRTGVLVGLALHLVGVDQEVIAADYAVTETRLRRTYDELLAQARPQDRERNLRFYRTPPEAMHATFDHLHTRYGGPSRYLERAGLRAEHVDALQSRLLA